MSAEHIIAYYALEKQHTIVLDENKQLKELLEYFMTADANSPEFDEKMSEALKLLED